MITETYIFYDAEVNILLLIETEFRVMFWRETGEMTNEYMYLGVL